MSATLLTKHEGISVLQARFQELEAECRRCLHGLSADPITDHTDADIDPKAIARLDEYCAETLRTILNTLCHLNSDPMRLQGVTIETNIPKALQIITQKYDGFRQEANSSESPLDQKRMERLCQWIVEHSIHDLLIPLKEDLQCSGTLDRHPALQALVQQLDACLPSLPQPNLCQ